MSELNDFVTWLSTIVPEFLSAKDRDAIHRMVALYNDEKNHSKIANLEYILKIVEENIKDGVVLDYSNKLMEAIKNYRSANV